MEHKEIAFYLEEERKSYIFYGEPDSTAASVEFRHEQAAGSPGPDPHVHLKQTETFHVLSGTMIAHLEGRDDVTLGPGEKIVIPPGAVHSFSNASETEPLVQRIVVEPALDFQWYMTEAAKLAIQKGGNMKKIPLIEAGHLMWLSRDEQRIGGMPYWMQDLLFGALSLLSRITGRAGNIGPKP